jgi:hypothetical protein
MHSFTQIYKHTHVRIPATIVKVFRELIFISIDRPLRRCAHMTAPPALDGSRGVNSALRSPLRPYGNLECPAETIQTGWNTHFQYLI